MKVLLVNGSPHQKGCTYTALKEAAKTLNTENSSGLAMAPFMAALLVTNATPCIAVYLTVTE